MRFTCTTLSDLHQAAYPEMIQQSEDSAASSLLSLSVAAANAVPILTPQDSAAPLALGSFNGPSSLSHDSHSTTSKLHNALKQRRLSSTGQLKRRLSDAREATSRPSYVLLVYLCPRTDHSLFSLPVPQRFRLLPLLYSRLPHFPWLDHRLRRLSPILLPHSLRQPGRCTLAVLVPQKARQ